MKFGHFYFKNFKGIDEITLSLDNIPNHNVYTLVGLNESGKTTILEAINYFTYKNENLVHLNMQKYSIDDVHELIPISKRDNFNGEIIIEASVILEPEDETIIRNALFANNFVLVSDVKKITYTQKYFFENSKYIKEKSKYLWSRKFSVKKKGGSKIFDLANEDAMKIDAKIKELIPSILYFPNFLFDFPDKIYLEEVTEQAKKHEFYKGIIQDILNSLENGLDVQTHIVNRKKSIEKNDNNHLESVLDKMGDKVSDTIFSAWDSIFNRKFVKKQIQFKCDIDEKNKVYLELKIKDADGKYLISERSLGFRWFFVFLLLTQFRMYRKQRKNAVFLFDEPASNLHSTAQSQLLQSFEKLPTVFFTTHSSYLIDPKWLENTYVVKNEGLTYNDDEEKFNSKMTKITIHKYREFATKYPNQQSYFQPILDVLDYFPSKIEMTPKVALLEGKNDYYTLHYINDCILKKPKKLNLMPCTSSSNMNNLISIYLSWNTDFIIVLDSDKEGEKQKKIYLKEFGEVIQNKIFTLKDVSSDWDNFELENLFEKNDKMNIQLLAYPNATEYNKTQLNRAIQELAIKSRETELSANTIANFNKLITFIKDKLASLTE